MNRGTLRTLTRDYLQESGTAPLSNALANDLLNEGQHVLAEAAEYSFATFAVTGGLVTNQHDYAFPSSLIRVWTIAVNDADGNLTPLTDQQTQQSMDKDYASWRTDDAARPERWWPVPNGIWLHPRPSAAYNGTPLELKGTRYPPDMDDDADTPVDLPDRFQRTLAKYAAYRWLQIDKENASAHRWGAIWQNEFLRDAVALRTLVRSRFSTDGAKLRLDPGRPSSVSALLGDDS